VSASAAVRLAREEDAEAVVGLAAMLNAEEEHPTPQRLSPGRLVADFFGADPAGLLLVAGEAASVVGYATGHMTYETNFAQRGLYIGDLYVHPACRRRGLGRALLAAMSAEAKRRGGSFLWWTARPGNVGAHGFYRGVGGVGEEVRAFALADAAFDRLATAGTAP